MFFDSLSFLTSSQHSFSNLVFMAKLCFTILNLNKSSRFFKIKCALNTCAIALLHLNWDMENKVINFGKMKKPFNWLQRPLHRNLCFLAINHIWNDQKTKIWPWSINMLTNRQFLYISNACINFNLFQLSYWKRKKAWNFLCLFQMLCNSLPFTLYMEQTNSKWMK
jgi:hypothetical protein